MRLRAHYRTLGESNIKQPNTQLYRLLALKIHFDIRFLMYSVAVRGKRGSLDLCLW